jgi:hypothetical protein
MKRILGVSMMALAFALPAMAQHSHAGHGAAAKPVMLTGEVLDMTCYMIHPDNATGMGHAKCAESCLAKGMSVGFLADDGTMYMVLGSNHDSPNEKVKGLAGKKSTITGVVHEQKGMKAIELQSIAETK